MDESVIELCILYNCVLIYQIRFVILYLKLIEAETSTDFWKTTRLTIPEDVKLPDLNNTSFIPVLILL